MYGRLEKSGIRFSQKTTSNILLRKLDMLLLNSLINSRILDNIINCNHYLFDDCIYLFYYSYCLYLLDGYNNIINPRYDE